MKKCKVAIIGAGNIAREHVRAFYDLKNVDICGITSRTRTKAELLSNEYGKFPVFPTIEELYKKTEADLVVVAVNVQSMKSISCQCFEYPWAVFLEKPIGINYEEGLEILATSKVMKSRTIVGLNRRFYSNLQTLKMELDKRMGEKRIIHVYDQQDEQKALALGHPEIIVKNWMYSNSIHLIDLFRFFGGSEIKSIQPIVSEKGEMGKKGVVISKVMYENGDIGIYEGYWNMPGPWAIIVNSGDYRWESCPLEASRVRTLNDRKDVPIPSHSWDRDFKPGFRLQAQEAVKFARREPSKSVLLEEGLRSMKLIHSIYSNQVFDLNKDSCQK